MKRKSSKEYWWKAESSSYEAFKAAFKGIHLCFLHGRELAMF